MGQGPADPPPHSSRKARERVPGGLQLGDLGVQRPDALRRQLAGTGPILGGVQGEQLGDLLQREPCRLRRTDEPQPADIRLTVAPDAAAVTSAVGAFRRLQQPAPLVVAHRFDADAPRTS